jgi:hypothetical protein
MAAHLVRDIVAEELDLTAVLSAYNESCGYPLYHPTMMVALLLYVYRHGVYSSQRRDPRVSAMRQRLRRAGRCSRYRLRKQVAEPVFGQIKQARDFHHFLLRGIEKVNREWAPICTAHNLTRLARAAAA